WHEAVVVDRGNGFVGVGAASGEAPFETTHSQGSPTINHARFVNPSTSGSAQVRTSLQRGNDQGSGLARGGVWFVTDQGLGFADYEARDLKFYTGETPGGASARIIVKPDGKVGVGKEPSAALDVDGPARVKSYTVATAPSASSAGEGAIIFVSDEAGGAVLAFSDGTDWRRVTDRAAIS
ncbi:hypothetical protein, partial [Roseovarius salis]|uniref:hypothetical protein n=1 Tax=Roseovarius salis TaxID=3376063 RepID=UPI0037CBB474